MAPLDALRSEIVKAWDFLLSLSPWAWVPFLTLKTAGSVSHNSFPDGPVSQ